MLIDFLKPYVFIALLCDIKINGLPRVNRFSINVTIMRRYRRMYISLKKIMIVLWSLEIRLVLSRGPQVQILSARATMEAHIVGGVPIDLELCPSAVLVYNLGSMCAGSILNSYTVLSAAHCFDHNSDVDEISVHVGEYFLSWHVSFHLETEGLFNAISNKTIC